MASRTVGTIWISLKFATAEFQAGLSNVQSKLKKFASSASDLGVTLSRSITAPLALIGGASVKAFADLDKAVVKSRTVLDATREQIIGVSRDLSEKFAFSSAQIAEGFYGLGQAGLSAAQAMEAMPKIAEYAQVAEVDLAKASRELIQVQTALGLAFEDPIKNMQQLTRVSDVLTKVANASLVDVQNFVDAMGSQLAGQLRISGVSIEEAAAALGVLADQGVKGARAGTMLTIAIRELGDKALKNSAAWEAFGKQIGYVGNIVYEASGQMRSPIAIIADMEKGFTKLSNAEKIVALQTLGFDKKSRGASQALLGMSGKMNQYLDVANHSARITHELAEKHMQAFINKLIVLRNRITNVAQDIGDKLGPTILRLGETLVKLLESFRNLDPKVQEFIVKFGAFLVVLGPVSFAIGQIAKLVAFLLSPLNNLLRIFIGLAKGGITFAVGLRLIPALLASVSTLAVGAAAAFLIWPDEIGGAVETVIGKIGDLYNSFAETFPFLSSSLEAAASVNPFTFLITGLDNVQKQFSEFWDNFSKEFPRLSVIIAAFAYDMARYVSDGINGIIQAWPLLVVGAQKAWDDIKKYAGDAVKAVEQSWAAFRIWFASNFPEAAIIAGEVWQKIQDLAVVAANFIIDTWDTVLGKIKSIAQAIDLATTLAAVAAKGKVENADVSKILGFGLAQAASQSKILSQGLLGAVGGAEALRNSFKGTVDAAKDSAAAVGKTGEEVDRIVAGRAGRPGGLANALGFKDAEAGAKKLNKELEKTAQALDKLKEKSADLEFDKKADELHDSLDTALEGGHFEVFETLKQELYQHIYDGTLGGLADGIKDAGNSPEAKALAENIAKQTADKEIEQLNQQRKKATEEHAKDLAEAQKKAYQESTDAWRSLLQQAFTDSSRDFDKDLKEVAIGFGAELANQFGLAMKGDVKTFEDVGALIGKGAAGVLGSLLGDSLSALGMATGQAQSSWSDSFKDMFKDAGSYGVGGWGTGAGGQGNTGGFYGPGGDPSGSGQGQAPISGGGSAAGYGQAGIGFYSDIANRKKRDEAGHNRQGTGAAAGGLAGGVAGGIFGGGAGAAIGQKAGSALGGFIGKFFGKGSANPETVARDAFGKWISDNLEKLSKVAFFDVQGKLQTFNADKFNLDLGGGKFNQVDWAKDLDKYGDRAKATFLGLGEALKSVSGITEDIGGQIGFLLAEKFNGSIDNARLLVAQLGLSFEDVEAALIKMGMSGEKSWHEIEVMLQGVSDAFEPGLVAIGDIKGAVDELVQSGGRGIAALKGVKDIAVEAMEAGAHSLQELQQRLLAQGVDPAEVEAIMKALEQRGIKTLEDLASASDRVAGGIVADIESFAPQLATLWHGMGEQIDEMTDKLNELPKELSSHITLEVDANVTDAAQQVLDSQIGDQLDIPATGNARGAVLKGPTFFKHSRGMGVAGERGAEAILPLANIGGTLGVRAANIGNSKTPSNSFIFQIDARGAEPGVESRIARVLSSFQENTANLAVQRVYDLARRGGGYSDVFGD